jgi:hypothetical protein
MSQQSPVWYVVRFVLIFFLASIIFVSLAFFNHYYGGGRHNYFVGQCRYIAGGTVEWRRDLCRCMWTEMRGASGPLQMIRDLRAVQSGKAKSEVTERIDRVWDRCAAKLEAKVRR